MMRLRLNWATIVLTIVLVCAAGCATLAPRQQAAVGLEAALQSVQLAREFERSVCDPSVPISTVLTSCTLQAHQLGLSDEKHRKLARLFATAFGNIATSASEFHAWLPIEARPTLDQLVSTLHLVKVETQGLQGFDAFFVFVDRALVQVQKVQVIR